MSNMTTDDPLFTSAPSSWIRAVLHHVGIDVILDDCLVSGCAASRERQAIWIRPGLEPVAAQNMMLRSALYIVGGHEWAPEFKPLRQRRHLRVVR